MDLAFSTHIKNKPTYFVEKSWSGFSDLLNEDIHRDWLDFEIGIMDKTPLYKFDYSMYLPKIHTIREDKSDRWKVGNNIHFVINNRTKNRFQFAPVLKVKSIQTIEIQKLNNTTNWLKDFLVSIDGAYLTIKEIENLAVNDGFDTVQDFFNWFDKDFKGKIIHWTDLKY